MKHSVWLPNDLSTRAKAAELKLSPLLRRAVIAELARKDAIAALETEMEEHVVDAGDRLVQFTGRLLYDSDEYSVFFTDDRWLLLNDKQSGAIGPVDMQASGSGALREVLDEESYVRVMNTLGIKPLVRLGPRLGGA